MIEVQGFTQAPPAAQMFGGAGREYWRKYGTTKEKFAKIARRRASTPSNNARSLFRQACSVEEILAVAEVFDPLTRYQCCPPTCGAAAAVLCSDEFAQEARHRRTRSHRGAGDDDRLPSTFEAHSMIKMVGYDMTARGREAGLRARPASAPTTSTSSSSTTASPPNELLTYEALGLCKEGEAEKFIARTRHTYGGKCVTNPSGGLLSKGHPLGATGLAQCTELVWQLRGQADTRQVEGAKVALQHNLGLGGACVVTMYRRNRAEN